MSRHFLTDIDLDTRLATCSICGPETKIRIYSNQRVGCLTSSRVLTEEVRRAQRLRRVGLTPETHAALMESQGNLCALCRGPFGDKPYVDHDHECCPPKRACQKCIRGILCNSCNTGLGKFKDDPAMLQRAIEYLQGV